jgi:hypothetical protein
MFRKGQQWRLYRISKTNGTRESAYAKEEAGTIGSVAPSRLERLRRAVAAQRVRHCVRSRSSRPARIVHLSRILDVPGPARRLLSQRTAPAVSKAWTANC